ncbi:uncharacterized protein LOC144348347 [Saccoglossus kowalevskii]
MAISLDAIRNTTKKDLFVCASLFLATFLLGTLVNDITQYTVVQNTALTTRDFTQSILFLHAISFYLSLLGFVYNVQSGQPLRTARLEWTAVVFNILVSAIRFGIEFGFLQYRKEEYRSFTEK